MSDYIVSARKYRPDSFESLIGQDNIAQTLKNSILRGQLAHAYLFCGPRGVGKTSAARIFAKTINCANPGPNMEPCGECESCKSFQEGRSYCIHELDAASNNGVEDIKNLMDQVQIPPQVGRYSVYIIDEVHMLSPAAFNAFLKTLEEPPAHAIFILATTEKHKIIPTILSRCQTYDFNRISIPDIVGNLKSIAEKENIKIDDNSLHVIAQKADGAMRDALTIFDQTVAFCGTDIKYEDVRKNLNVLDFEYGFKLVDSFLAADHRTALLTFDEILGAGFNALYFISSLGSHIRDLIICRTGGMDSLLDLPDQLKERYREQAGRCNLKFLFDCLQIISQCEAGYRAATNQRLHIEFALMKMAFLGGVPGTAESPQPAKAPAAAPVAAPVNVAAPAKAVEPAPVPAPAPATTPAPTPAPAAAPARHRPAKSASGLSISAMIDDTSAFEPIIETSESETGDNMPSDETIVSKWKEVAASQSEVRVANALGAAKVELREEDGNKVLDFYVVNEAQRKWIIEKSLRQMEADIQKLANCSRIRLCPKVTPVEQQEKKLYMPAEKAQDLMNKNEEIKNLVIDLGLDIK